MKPRSLLAAMAVLLAWGATARAHEKWFYEGERKPLRWDLFFRPLPLGFAAGVLVVTALALVWWRARRGRDLVPGPEAFGARPERRIAFYGFAPAILGAHVAVPLFVNGVLGRLFSPNNQMTGAWAHWLGLLETLIGLSFLYGGLARVAAAATFGLWLIGIPVVGLEPMLENLHYLGFAGLFYLSGRGPISIDRLLFPRLEPPDRWVPHGPWLLRLGIGGSLLVVGFTEKLANLPLAEAFLHQYPFINFMPGWGIPMSDEVFALCAGSVEVLAGLIILLGIFPRAIILIALLPLNLSLTVFNWVELIGHMPFYGALAFLLVWTPADRDLWFAGLRHGPLGLEGGI